MAGAAEVKADAAETETPGTCTCTCDGCETRATPVRTARRNMLSLKFAATGNLTVRPSTASSVIIAGQSGHRQAVQAGYRQQQQRSRNRPYSRAGSQGTGGRSEQAGGLVSQIVRSTQYRTVLVVY